MLGPKFLRGSGGDPQDSSARPNQGRRKYVMPIELLLSS
ncbi:hypothetical protein STAFG_3652 [Streptomyces afghaniensis 772]|uniref:Uncharacterized protein n=1 Tax=Streptomyces afghaniensis 772 TaxID=1283301 RepID=S4MUF0_9ACTN|nr:hypothetical protein STAFG_3652 [Streptomyces afghaniensis 772]